MSPSPSADLIGPDEFLDLHTGSARPHPAAQRPEPERELWLVDVAPERRRGERRRAPRPEGTGRGRLLAASRAPRQVASGARPLPAADTSDAHALAAAPATSDAHALAAAPAPPSPCAAAAIEAEIDRARARAHVPRLAVHLARAYAAAAVCFVVRHDVIAGECGEGLAPGVRAEGMMLPVTAPAFFADVVATAEPFRGAPLPDDLGRRVLSALGREHVREITVLPVVVADRVVSLLYADNGPEVLSDASAAALSAVARRMARAYERLIAERKRARTDS